MARELVDIPVIGPMEASLQMGGYFGRSVAIVTDHRKACEAMRDHALVIGLASNIRGYEAIVLNCTIIAACYQSYLMKGGVPADVPVINPNLIALKMAESLADLHQKKAYQISRAGFYQKPREDHFRQVTERARRAWLDSKSSLRKSFG